MEGEEDEDDIWEEKSLKQLKRKLQNSTYTFPHKNVKSKRSTSTVNEGQRASHLEASQATRQDKSKASKASGNAKNGRQKRKRSDSSNSIVGSRTIHQRTDQCSSPVSNDKVTPHKDITDGCCPKCQMPFCALNGQSPGWHVSECLETKYSYVGMSQ